MISRRQQHAFVFWCVTLLRGSAGIFRVTQVRVQASEFRSFSNPAVEDYIRGGEKASGYAILFSCKFEEVSGSLRIVEGY